MGKFWFVTFGDSRLVQAHARIHRQVGQMGIFDGRTRIMDEKNLDEDFCLRMKDRMIMESRGFGYWCWKPQVIWQVLREMDDGDILLYVDIGCHLNVNGLSRLKEYGLLALKYGVVGFQFRPLGEAAQYDYTKHFYLERQWTKMDLLNYFRVADNESVTSSGQVQGCVAVFHNCLATRELVNSWRNVYFDHFELVNDSPSKAGNFPDFQENRHDQSVFSLLCKTRGACLLSCGEIEHIRCHMPQGANERLWPEYWREMKQYPVHARRDLGKYTTLVECPDWLKPILGKAGRRFASKTYEVVKPIITRIRKILN